MRRVLCLLAIPLLTTGCTRPINRAAERRIRDVLPAYIGPARRWLAHVENAPERTIRGKLSRVTIEGSDVELARAVSLGSLRIEIRDADVDTRKGMLRRVGSTHFRAVITEAGLNRYIRDFPPPPEEPVRYNRVRLRDGGLDVQGIRRVLGRDISFSISTEPVLVGVNELRFEPERMRVAGLPVPLPAAALRWLAHRLSEGMNFSTLPFSVQVIKVSATRSGIEFIGSADVMESLNRRLSAWLNETPEPIVSASDE